MKVVIIQQSLPSYRVAFFQELRKRLEAADIELVLYAGRNQKANISDGFLPWARTTPIHRFLGLTLQYNCPEIWTADLVIVEQAVKHLLTYALFARRAFTKMRLAFWGHGKNFQSANPASLPEAIKRYLSRHVDWWFAYNGASVGVVAGLGFPADRITDVQNAIDVRSLQARKSSLSASDISAFREAHQIFSPNTVVYAGGLYGEKRIPFLIAACHRIRAAIPDFEILIMGKGPQVSLIEEACMANPWMKFVGQQGEAEKVPFWAVSKLLLMPGLVGLVVLDSFALGVPMVTTAFPHHSPEIAYLKNEIHGVVVADWENVEAYAAAVIGLLQDEPRRTKLVENCLVASGQYSIENMAGRFADGIQKALAARKQ